MQYAFHFQFFNENKIVGTDRVGHENKSFVVNLSANVIAHPILVVEVKQPRIDRLDDSMAPGGDGFQKMTQDCRFLLFALFFAVSLTRYQGIFNRKLIVVDQHDFPFLESRKASSYHGQRYILDEGYFDIFLHAYAAKSDQTPVNLLTTFQIKRSFYLLKFL